MESLLDFQFYFDDGPENRPTSMWFGPDYIGIQSLSALSIGGEYIEYHYPNSISCQGIYIYFFLGIWFLNLKGKRIQFMIFDIV